MFCKKGFLLEISQNSQENTCAWVSFLIKLQASTCNFIKKRLWHRCFPVNCARFLRTPFLREHIRGFFWISFIRKLKLIQRTTAGLNSQLFDFGQLHQKNHQSATRWYQVFFQSLSSHIYKANWKKKDNFATNNTNFNDSQKTEDPI